MHRVRDIDTSIILKRITRYQMRRTTMVLVTANFLPSINLMLEKDVHWCDSCTRLHSLAGWLAWFNTLTLFAFAFAIDGSTMITMMTMTASDRQTVSFCFPYHFSLNTAVDFYIRYFCKCAVNGMHFRSLLQSVAQFIPRAICTITSHSFKPFTEQILRRVGCIQSPVYCTK